MAIDFEQTFSQKRSKSYDTKGVGEWWQKRSTDDAHHRAYRNIAASVCLILAKRQISLPRFIVDYACGNGSFLKTLAGKLPNTNFVAIDASEKMLISAKAKLERIGCSVDFCSIRDCFREKAPRIRLVLSSLPNFSIPQGNADAVVFLFPNIIPARADHSKYEKHGFKNRADVAVAEILARLREMDPEDEFYPYDPPAAFYDIVSGRVVSKNIRGLLKKEGIWFKVDLANCPREELTDLTRWKALFSEYALDIPVKGKMAASGFRYLESRFSRSKVVLDAYYQSGNPAHKTGGYFISAFEAL